MLNAENLQMPLVALRGRVICPYTTVSFDAGRLKTLQAIKLATESQNKTLIVCAQKDSEKEDIGAEDIFTVGTVVRIERVTPLPAGRVRVSGRGLYKASATIFDSDDGFMATTNELATIHTDPALEEAYFRTTKSMLRDIASSDTRFSKDAIVQIEKCGDGDEFSYLAIDCLPVNYLTQQEILQKDKLIDMFSLLDKCLNDELEISRLERKISAAVRQNIEKNQREYYLREQLKAIHAELGDDEDEKAVLEQKIKEKNMPAEIEEKTLKELSRMSRMQSSSPDYNVIRTYLDWMLDLEWNYKTEDTENLNDAVEILNADHYGLEKIKERITEYLAVLKLTNGMNAPILCFVGPPGVGKTSVAMSIARALGRKFVRMSLGGVKDEAEIRGHRKTYVGAMPGRIINGMKNAGCTNPVFLLDEIDKLSSDMRGDPASALLEVLDPAQNSTFRDRYLEVPYDLSKVLFITTANSLDTIPGPLLDRMEIIELNGYTQEEKREIAKRYLVPKKVAANGLKEDEITFSDEALDEIISGYTMEAGVRNLERKIDAVCRKFAVCHAENKPIDSNVTKDNLAEFLGAKRYERDIVSDCDRVGAATGLAWTSVGGTTLTIEVSAMHGKGEILLTGKLGDVMKESARAAISYIRSNSDEYGISQDAFETTDIHVHVPEGATPKDGPSAGITMATAILSAFTKKSVKHNIAMTGEITLLGKVLPIGGLKEKALAAYRIGIRDVIIPEENKKDLEEIPESVREKLHFIPVSQVSDVFKTAINGI
jgi:ATP-dependent Lon protease